ncbi:single-stranded DNA-binding protein [Pseudomonas fluorescens]|uniref:single-stranded DNA-binding protein n=1 Tax=Pseudomonas TaxID=286 RepID=UPI000F02EACA|nr:MULTISPECIES: single-stranded DNA-binding protein [Pseudomonas]MBD8089182.1 single-stranded DNA-binding protein [Pseudomonas fluorescens]MBD8615391.1 single-stranded DNA-binding protein [Pseudomonas putida]MBD8681955.1 single-stranded DNA-binding protein [Pseudomonas sp. CFBP 13719]
MQKHTIAGNLVSAATLATRDGRDSLSFVVAINEGKNAATGETYTTYVPVIVSGAKGFADSVKEYLVKGKQVTASGESYVSVNEKDNNVYQNPGIRLRSLRNGLSLSGEGTPINAANVADHNQPISQDAQEAVGQQGEMQEEVLQEGPGASNDVGDDDIPF